EVDGFELCRQLRSDPQTRNVPVIFVTAERTSTASVIEGLDAGGFDYITKPFDQAELLARVRVMLRLRAAEHSLLAVQQALDAQNRQLSFVNDRLAEGCQQMLEQRIELTHKTHALERANKVKSEFLAKMSHELRTPLNSIIGFSDLMMLDEKEPPGAGQAKRLERIGRNGRQLLALINDILDLSKIEADHMTLSLAPVDVTAVGRECIDLVRPLLNDKPVRLEVEVPQDELVWEGDEVRLQQIVTNLLSNAAKFTDAGTIRLEVSGDDEGVRITVSDTGIGIAPEHLECVFDPFRQVDSSTSRRAGGTGLGLPICRKLCRLMGGTVTAQSQLGSGSTFEVLLPWQSRQCKLDVAHESTRPSDEQSRLILLCSEDTGMVDLTATHLAMHGINVHHTPAWDAFRSLVCEERPDGVIIDIRATEVAAFLRSVISVAPPIPWTWLSAWTEDHQLGYVIHLDDYMIASEETTRARADRWCPAGRGVVVWTRSETVARDLQRVLTRPDQGDVRTVTSKDDAIALLSSERGGTLFVDLAGFTADALHVVSRARQLPDRGAVRVVGVVPPCDDRDQIDADAAPTDEFIRQHGMATPTLLLDLAEALTSVRAPTTPAIQGAPA
ncbi:MAG TPA: ATP-binding protein, partial [Gammaproteobacteria bacterium]|nr:ATP-binding protein [Gammaproteobacteria bacterium]